MIFDEGGVYFKNEGEDKVINPHVENLILNNNDESLQPYKVKSRILPITSSPLNFFTPTISKVDTRITPPSSPARKQEV